MKSPLLAWTSQANGASRLPQTCSPTFPGSPLSSLGLTSFSRYWLVHHLWIWCLVDLMLLIACWYLPSTRDYVPYEFIVRVALQQLSPFPPVQRGCHGRPPLMPFIYLSFSVISLSGQSWLLSTAPLTGLIASGSAHGLLVLSSTDWATHAQNDRMAQHTFHC